MPRRQKKQTKKQKEKQNKLNEKAKKHLEKRWNKKNEIKEEDQQNENKNDKNDKNDNNNKNNKKDFKNYKNKKKDKNENRKKRKKERKQKEDMDEKFKKSLEEIGYFIREVEGDGNCLFRSVSEQVEGNENSHIEYREKCVNYMKDHKEIFEPFIEDDEPFDDYIKRMSKDREWGGNLEIYALSMLLEANFYIYIYEQPMYVVKNFEKPKKNIKLTYHEGKHYNSLRKLEEKNKDDKEKEEKKKKERENEDKEESEGEEEEDEKEESEDPEDDIKDLISKVSTLNI